MALNQVHQTKGRVDRVPRGEDPFVELNLEEHEYLASFEIHEAPWMNYRCNDDRKTVDWLWTAVVVTRCG